MIAAALAALVLTGGYVNVDGHRMYYACSGSGSPTVVLDAGSPDTSAVWSTVQPALARHTRVCAYDRAGLGRSAPVKGVRTLRRQVDDVRGLLAAARIPPPYVVVGHSWGGLIARVFAHDYQRLTAGVVLVDATTFPYGAPGKRKLREGVDPAEALRESNAVTAYGALPLVVLGHGAPPLNAKFLEAQDAEAALSTDAVDAIARRSGHYIQRDQPGVVVAAVLGVVAAVRIHGRLPACASLFRDRAVGCR
jgi:pimeloyl-ACP methyl ester carboxylesterase